MSTTIQVELKVKNHLNDLKYHSKETYNDVLLRVFQFLSYQAEEEELSDQTIKNIEKSLADIKAGRVSSHKDVKRKLGLK